MNVCDHKSRQEDDVYFKMHSSLHFKLHCQSQMKYIIQA